MRRRMMIATAGALATLALAGCSASASLTVPASDVADQAAKALQKQVESESAPGMDCGDDAVPLTEGQVVDCELTDPASGNTYDSTVTLSEIEGTRYHIEVQVAETPNG